MWQHLSATLGAPFAIVGPRSELYDTGADTPGGDEYGAPDFPAEARAHLVEAGARAGCTWPR